MQNQKPLRQLLDAFLKRPSNKTLDNLHDGCAHGCIAEQMTDGWQYSPYVGDPHCDCSRCPISGCAFPVSLCSMLENTSGMDIPSLIDYFDYHQAEVILAMVKLRSWIELFEETKDEGLDL